MDDKEQPQGKQSGRNYWIWGIPAAVLVYTLSIGPVCLFFRIIEKIGCDIQGIFLQPLIIFYFPIIVIARKFPILKNFLEAYVEFWVKLAGN
jgi:hypothetical protein